METTYLVTLSPKAQSQIEDRGETNFCYSYYTGKDYSILVDLCSDWIYRYLPSDLRYLGEGGYNDGQLIEDDLYKVWLDTSNTWAKYRFVESPSGEKYIRIESFNYKKGDTRRSTLNDTVILEKNDHNISFLSEFHSWMHRLDEVKGAKPTFWIEG